MGSAGIFASGSAIELKGGDRIGSKDPARSRAAVTKLGANCAERRHGAAGLDPGHRRRDLGQGERLPVELDIANGPTRAARPSS